MGKMREVMAAIRARKTKEKDNLEYISTLKETIANLELRVAALEAKVQNGSPVVSDNT